MSEPAYLESRSRATYADVLAAPPNRNAEILDGELVLSPRPVFAHARAVFGLGGGLQGPFDVGSGGPGGWWILPEPELHLGDDVLVPDLAGWRRERVPAFPNVPHTPIAPDWVCEVLSPSTARRDRIIKSRIYAREGVSHLWIVDPLAQTLEVFELRDGLWVQVQTFAGDEAIRARPFDAVELEMKHWWVPTPSEASETAE